MTSYLQDHILRTTAPYMRADEQILWMGHFQKGGGWKADRHIKIQGAFVWFYTLSLLFACAFLGWMVHISSLGCLPGIFVLLMLCFLEPWLEHQLVKASGSWYLLTNRQLFIWVENNRRLIVDPLRDLSGITVTMGKNGIGRIDYEIGGEIVLDKVDYSISGQKVWLQICAPRCNFHCLCGIPQPEQLADQLKHAVREVR